MDRAIAGDGTDLSMTCQPTVDQNGSHGGQKPGLSNANAIVKTRVLDFQAEIMAGVPLFCQIVVGKLGEESLGHLTCKVHDVIHDCDRRAVGTSHRKRCKG